MRSDDPEGSTPAGNGRLGSSPPDVDERGVPRPESVAAGKLMNRRFGREASGQGPLKADSPDDTPRADDRAEGQRRRPVARPRTGPPVPQAAAEPASAPPNQAQVPLSSQAPAVPPPSVPGNVESIASGHEQPPVSDLSELLRTMIDSCASDLHITSGVPPKIRVDGALQPMDYAPLDPRTTQAILYGVMTDDQKAKLEDNLEVDFSFGLKDLARFRANVFMQRGAVAGALRVIPWHIPGFEELGLPDVIRDICEEPRGLVLVTGPTGSGKSTTLAAMIDLINETKPHHIITIEDPIEYLHKHKTSVINQRELHADTHSFSAAMRSALREDPDCVLIGEMRDLESAELALQLAETGHLTFGTLHTNSAVQAINRIIDIFATGQRRGKPAPSCRSYSSLASPRPCCRTPRARAVS